MNELVSGHPAVVLTVWEGCAEVLDEGERIAVDMRLLSGAIEVDLSTLTGESASWVRSSALADADVPRLAARDSCSAHAVCRWRGPRGGVRDWDAHRHHQALRVMA